MSSSDPSDMEHMGSSGLNSPLLSNHHNEHSAVRLNSFTSLSLSLSLSVSLSLSPIPSCPPLFSRQPGSWTFSMSSTHFAEMSMLVTFGYPAIARSSETAEFPQPTLRTVESSRK